VNPADLSKLQPRLRAMALYALGDDAIAQDVAQEAVARALARAHELREPEKAVAFVLGIARHIITDHIRAKKRVEVGVDDVDIYEPHPDALAVLLADEQRDQLRAALTHLSTDDREVLRLSYDEGLGPAEIATRLNQPYTAVRKRKSRALERLRTLMAEADASHNRGSEATLSREDTRSYQGGGSIAAEL
jgi:RNA polymerase sigma-70 factor (ECF subfamily)